MHVKDPQQGEQGNTRMLSSRFSSEGQYRKGARDTGQNSSKSEASQVSSLAVRVQNLSSLSPPQTGGKYVHDAHQ